MGSSSSKSEVQEIFDEIKRINVEIKKLSNMKDISYEDELKLIELREYRRTLYGLV